MAAKRIAVYPGTFDPLTNGHVSIIKRGLKMFDKVLVAVAKDNSKQPLFSLDERVSMVRQTFAKNGNVLAEPFSGLLVDFVQKCGSNIILRGLRAVSDFDYEFQMALMNRKLRSEVQTVFLMTDFRWMYISSTFIRNLAQLGGDVGGMVPPQVLPYLRQAFALPISWPYTPLPGAADSSAPAEEERA